MARRRQAVQGPIAHVESLPPPVGGWNARDALANMAPTDAVTLTNLFPTPSTVQLRGGSTNYATGMAGEVQSLLVYNGAAVSHLFAVEQNSLSVYDVSNPGPVGAAVVSGLTNPFWEYANIATPGGSFMYAVNGADKPLFYDGTTWTHVDGASTPAITGVATNTLTHVLLHMNRLWFIQKNTLKLWYLPTLSIGGAAQQLDLSAIARKGGYLVSFDVWTTDAGYGLTDMLVMVTSQGEVIIYRGTDPATAATWELVGVWAFGAPITKRCFSKWGGDLLLNILDGLLPLSLALQSDRLDQTVALSNKIQNAISLASTAWGANTGWAILSFPAENALILNVPIAPGQQQQYVMNTLTKSWCNFTGWNANCWALFKDKPYFGTTTAVARAWDATYGDNAADIQTLAVQAYNYFQLRGVEKYFTRARPNIISTGAPAVQIGLSIDFNLSESVSPISFSSTAYAIWDLALWDIGVWGQSQTLTSNWQGVAGIGYCAAPIFQSASKGIQLGWASTDIVFQTGWSGI